MSAADGAATPAPFDLLKIREHLPAGELRPGLERAFATASPRIVIEAPPGSGKTTVVPPVIANVLSATEQPRVIVAEPRRLAARAAAARLAQLSRTSIGDLAGYSVRGDRKVSERTRVEFVTNGLLLRRLLADPALTGVGAVVLDEVHERDLDGDLAFAMAAQIADLRGDLAVVAMSATLDADRWAALLGSSSTVLSVAMQPHPLRHLWAPPPAGVARIDDRGITPAFLTHVARTAAQAFRTHPDGSVLVFVPGQREVDRIVTLVREQGILTLPLHGSMTGREQDAVLTAPPNGERRVIVATSIAESSLTVPDVRTVVDAGLAREPRMDARRGFSGLVTVPASQASVAQRAGRAARLGPGVAVHCGDEQSLALAPAHSRPAITTADLTSTALTLAAWGDPEGLDLALPDRPPVQALDAAQQSLIALGALTEREHADGHGPRLRITERGRRLAAIPTSPRQARALLDGAPLVGAARAAELVAALDSDARAPGADFAALVRQLRNGSSPATSRWRRDADRLARLLSSSDHRQDRTATSVGDEQALGLVVGLAFPERLARLRAGTSHEYVLASGTAATLPRDSALHGAAWLAIADVSRVGANQGTGALIRSAAPISRDIAETAGAHLLSESIEATWRDDRLKAERVRALGSLELSRTSARLAQSDAREHVRRLLLGPLSADAASPGTHGEGTQDAPLGILRWSPAADELRRRLALLRHVLGDPWPDVRDTPLAQRLDEWLAPEIDALAVGHPARELDLVTALRRLLPWPDATRLDELAPERLGVPSGEYHRLVYPPLNAPDAPPVLAVKLQECFGWLETPRIVDGRVPVQLQLLSPAQRPVAITADLASFWADGYQQVRSELRGRYPKHPWPEDPLTAAPTRHTKRRQQG